MIEYLEAIDPITGPAEDPGTNRPMRDTGFAREVFGKSQAQGPGEDHPMREVTRQVAFEANGWHPGRARKVEALFDSLASEWASRHAEDRLLPLRDALDRGRVRGNSCHELGAGTGPGTEVLRKQFDRVYAFDLSREMLRRLDPAWGHRVRADGAMLPLADASVEVLVLMNMLLFPQEVDRILAPGGAVVWVNSRGTRTPIHLPPEDVAAALPGYWEGHAAQAGQGLWCVLRRA